MIDLIFEIIQSLVVGSVFIFLFIIRKNEQLNTINGWNYIIWGFGLVLMGIIIDITDNFKILNQYIIIGETQFQAVLEKIFGYLLGFVFIAVGIWKWIPGMIELREKRKRELEKAKEEIKTLSGFLPICASCKKIRDDKGYWKQIESYIEAHSDAHFSHCLCEACSDKIYGEEDWYKQSKKNKQNKE